LKNRTYHFDLSDNQPVRVNGTRSPFQAARITRRVRKTRRFRSCLLTIFLVVLPIIIVLGAYFLTPLPTNLLILGIDRTPEGTALGRSDTNILVTINPLKPHVAALSIPRDLWVTIPGVGENRINTAHFFAEADAEGSGPAAAMQTVRVNFNVPVSYYIRFQFDGFKQIVTAMGGVTIELEEPMAGYPAGTHHLDPDQALAFVRDRKGADDFFRMQHAQVFYKAMLKQMLKPANWIKLPNIIATLFKSIDTNLPPWQWPRLALAVVRAGPSGIDARTIDREMVTPYITDSGANVLLPRWDVIMPVVDEMFHSPLDNYLSQLANLPTQ
jgi:LCP family protein required for cell wall assembly